MKQLKKDIQALSKILRQLTKKTESMGKKLAKLEIAEAKKLKAKAAAKKTVKKVAKKKTVKKAASKKVAKKKITKKAAPKKAAKKPAKKAAPKKAVKKPAKKAAPKKAARKPAKKAVKKKGAKPTAIEIVSKIINSSKKGVNMDQLKAKTGFDSKKIYNVVNRLKVQGKIKSIGQGIYTKK